VLQEASLGLLKAALALDEPGGSEGLARALDRRIEAFEAVRVCAAASASPDPELREILATVQDLDQRITFALQTRRGEVQAELLEIRRGRTLMRQVRAGRGTEPARFVSRRV